jgi:alpha-L-fucosidase
MIITSFLFPKCTNLPEDSMAEREKMNFRKQETLEWFTGAKYGMYATEGRPENRNKPEREEWLRDLGFGMFIHFSYDSQLGVVISHSMVGASDDYIQRYIYELPKTFNPDRYDAYRIAELAKLAGMKYIVFTTKHHSGFCMWDTKTTDFKITNTPYQRDLLKEFVEGTRKAGLAVGFYYSPEDFNFLYNNNITIRRRGLEIDEATQVIYDEFIRKQTNELFTNYGKIDVLFIDGYPEEPCRDEAWNLQPDLVITRGAVATPEQTLLSIVDDRLWEACITMGTQWAYKATNDDMKSGGRLIELLIETRAKGGNLLLNIGPHPDGYIAYEEETRLRELAAWNFINYEAIQSVRPWIVPREENIWFTASKDRKTVYAIITGITDWNRGSRKEFVLRSVKVTPGTKMSVLGQNDKVVEYRPEVDAGSKYVQKDDGLHISVVRAQRIYNNHRWPNPVVIKLENVLPALEPPIIETTSVNVFENIVRLNGNIIKKGDAEVVKVGFEYRPYVGIAEILYTDWQKTEFIEVGEEGSFSLELKKIEKGGYEYRAIIIHPMLTVYGDILRFTF